MKKLVLIAVILCASWGMARAQLVSTFMTGNGLNGPDGFALDTAQNLYVANWGGGTGNTVLKVTPSAVSDTFDNSSSAPDGLAFDEEGNLYVSNYASGIIHKITPTGSKTVYASGFINPSALAFDTAGNLYVSNNGSTTVSRISPGGSVSVFATGFSAPLGLVFDPAGNLYVSSYNTGKVHKVAPDGSVTLFATVPNGSTSRIQYLARGQSGNLYLPAYGHHKIYRISPSGTVSVLAGTGVPGSRDGSVDSARFNGPNSIVITPGGDLFVSEYNANRIRRITGVEFPLGEGGSNMETHAAGYLLQNYPNPFNALTTIPYRLSVTGKTEVRIYDTYGTEVWRQEAPVSGAGNHSVILPPGAVRIGLYIIRLYVNGKLSGTRKTVCINPAF